MFPGRGSYNPQAELAEFKNGRVHYPSNIIVSLTQHTLFTDGIDNTLQRDIPVIRVDSNDAESKRLMLIGTANVQTGNQIVGVVVELLNGKDNIVVITTPRQLNLD